MKDIWMRIFGVIFLGVLSFVANGQDIFVPEQVAVVYVILQKPGPLVDGSSELLAKTDREEFIRELPRYAKIAKDKQMRLVITAANADESLWLHSKIKYKGAPLRPAMYRDPGQSKSWSGSEVPLQ